MSKLNLFDDQEEPGKLNAYFVVKYVSKLSGVLVMGEERCGCKKSEAKKISDDAAEKYGYISYHTSE